MRIIATSIASVLVSSAAVAANPIQFSGTCGGGGSYDFVVDFDTAVFVGVDLGIANYAITPVPVDFCGVSTAMTTIQVSSTLPACELAGHSIAVLNDVLTAGVLLIDTSATVLTGTSLPTSLSTDDFDAFAAATPAECGTLPGADFGTVVIGEGPTTGLTLLERVDLAGDLGATTYTSLGLPGTPRLRTPAAMESALVDPVTQLEAAGCAIDGHVGGAYSLASFAAADDGGAMTGTFLDRGTKSWSGTLSGNGPIVDGGYNRQAQSVGFRDDGGFYVGQFVRTLGTRGTFYGVTGTCPVPLDFESVIGSWYRGELPGTFVD